ncbi:MAG: DUF721 domain-containing protein [Terriglobia bacterium]
MEEIARILPKVLQKAPLRRRQPVLEILVPLWPRVVGKLIARFSRPASYHQGVLTVAASSPPWATQIREMREEIRAKVNGFLGAPVVKKLRVRYALPLQLEAEIPAPEAQAAMPPENPSLRLPWTEDENRLEPEIARIVERSFRKYFSRAGKDLN